MARDGEAPHHLTFERRGPVEWITIDRPRALNALAAATLRALRIRFEALRYEPDIRVVILIGAGGKAFSTGLDVKEAVSQSASCPTDAIAAEVWRQQRGWSDTIKALRSAPQPVIALLDGLALGGGFGLALAADVRLATESTRMNVQSVLIGTTGCDIGISYYLPRSVGPSVASELMLTGRMLTAARAERLGLISEVHPSRAAMVAAAETLAHEMARAGSHLALGLTKQGIGLAMEAGSLDAALAIEDRHLSAGAPRCRLCQQCPRLHRESRLPTPSVGRVPGVVGQDLCVVVSRVTITNQKRTSFSPTSFLFGTTRRVSFCPRGVQGWAPSLG